MTLHPGGIELNAVEQRLAKYIATLRTQHDRASGARATVYGDQSHSTMEINSVGAELAFCKLFNVWPDLDTEHFGKMDAVLKDGRTVDIKTTTRNDGRLLVKCKPREACDLYAMMVGKFPSYRFAGWMSGKDILSPHRIDNSLPFPAHTAKQEELQH